MQLRVMTLNLRRDNGEDGAYAWPRRVDAVKALISTHAPDILCTQEAYSYMADSVSAGFPHYDRVGTGRMADGGDEHVALFLDRRRLRIIEHGQFWISLEPDVPGSKAWGTIFPRICSWCVTADQGDGTQFAVFNVHLDNRRVEARRAAAPIIEDRMLKMRQAFGDDLPVILCGDFNAFPDAEELRSFCADSGPAGITLEGCDGVTSGTFHGFRGVPGDAPIDYVLTGPGIELRRRFVDDRQYLSTWPSDHFPVIADLHVPEVSVATLESDATGRRSPS